MTTVSFYTSCPTLSFLEFQSGKFLRRKDTFTGQETMCMDVKAQQAARLGAPGVCYDINSASSNTYRILTDKIFFLLSLQIFFQDLVISLER